MKQSTINFSSLTKDLILATSTKEQNCSQEELYFALNCLLRAFHSTLHETIFIMYMQNWTNYV
ncbi:hypothetical protein ACT4US_06210, partial [Bacillus sp. HC-Mk]